MTVVTHRTGLLPFDPEKHARFATAESLGFTWPDPSYPIDRTGGLTDLGMGGNGPDPTQTVYGGTPVGDCGVNAEPKNVDQTTAALGAVAGFTAMSSDRTVRLYFVYQAQVAGVAWRPPPLGTPWTTADINQAQPLDVGVDLGDWLLWGFTHDEDGNEVAPGQGLNEGFVAVPPGNLEAALGFASAVVVGVALNDQAEQQFSDWQAGTNPAGWDVGPGDAPNPNDGHAITCGYAGSAEGPYKWGSWACFVPSTFGWRSKCVQQVFAVLTKEDAEAAGFPYAQAVAALVDLGGKAAPNPNAPTPPSTPPPPAPVGPVPSPPAPVPPAPVPSPPAPGAHHCRRHHWWWSNGEQVDDEGSVIPLPTWTDSSSVAHWLTAALGIALAVIAMVKPGLVGASTVKALQGVIPMVGTAIAAVAVWLNAKRLHVTKLVLWNKGAAFGHPRTHIAGTTWTHREGR